MPISAPTIDSDMRVGYPGRDGAHSAAACDRLFPHAELVPLPTFHAVVDATASGGSPSASSIELVVRPVAETHDLLYGSALAITAETVLSIRHFLVAIEHVPLEEIRVVRSHPVALDQCRAAAAMPWATAIAAPTTGDAAAQVAANGTRRKPRSRVSVPRRSTGSPSSRTTWATTRRRSRFVSDQGFVRLDVNGKAWRTAFSFVTDHQPGALHRAIEPFARHRIDLLQLVSRPIPQAPWRYRFDAVLAGHPLDPIVRETLQEIRASTRQLRALRSYPAEERE